MSCNLTYITITLTKMHIFMNSFLYTLLSIIKMKAYVIILEKHQCIVIKMHNELFILLHHFYLEGVMEMILDTSLDTCLILIDFCVVTENPSVCSCINTHKNVRV